MRLVIREYLEMLRESKEFDQVIPDLLLSRNIVPLSKPQIGVRQAGVDIAAVGNDEAGKNTLWLFVLKRGDIGRREWDSQSQSVRQSIDEAREVYLRNHVDPQYSSLPVKIVVATTGDRKQEIEQNWIGYVGLHEEKGRIEYEFWNGDQVAAQMERYLFNEYVMPPEARSELRRTLALVGEPDYDMQHFYRLLDLLLRREPDDLRGASKAEKRVFRSLTTINLALAIVCKWADIEGNLRNAVLASERTLLWTWDTINKHELTENADVMQRYFRVLVVYLGVTTDYFNKLQPYFHTQDGIARYHSESALLREQIFEVIGFVASIGLSHLSWACTTEDEDRSRSAQYVLESLEALIKNHKCSGSPCYDSQVIDITLALLFFCCTDCTGFASQWVRELVGRMAYGFRVGRWFPVSTDSFDDLVQLEINPGEVDLSKLQETSWMVATIAQWAALLGEDDAYQALSKLREESLKDMCPQLWYPDEGTDSFRYRGPAHHETGITEAPLVLPVTAEEMRMSMRKIRAESPISKTPLSSATRAGIPFLDLIASRHFRTPIDPVLWQALNTDGNQGSATEDQGRG